MESRHKTIFIYALIDPRDNAVRYVGRTVYPDLRLSQHLGKCTGKAKQEWLAELKANGLTPRMEILEQAPYNNRKSIEKFWIVYHLVLGCSLTNYQGNWYTTKSIYYEAVTRYLAEGVRPLKIGGLTIWAYGHIL